MVFKIINIVGNFMEFFYISDQISIDFWFLMSLNMENRKGKSMYFGVLKYCNLERNFTILKEMCLKFYCCSEQSGLLSVKLRVTLKVSKSWFFFFSKTLWIQLIQLYPKHDQAEWIWAQHRRKSIHQALFTERRATSSIFK